MTNAELADDIQRLIDGAVGVYLQHTLSYEEWQQIIAALRQSSDKVLVPREPTRAMLDALNKWAQCEGYIEEGYRAMLSTAEAERHQDSKERP